MSTEILEDLAHYLKNSYALDEVEDMLNNDYEDFTVELEQIGQYTTLEELGVTKLEVFEAYLKYSMSDEELLRYSSKLLTKITQLSKNLHLPALHNLHTVRMPLHLQKHYQNIVEQHNSERKLTVMYSNLASKLINWVHASLIHKQLKLI